MSEVAPSFPAEAPLTPGDIEELANAILDAYRDMDDLVRLLYYKWGVRLGEFIFLETPGRKVVDNLIDWADEQGRTRELLGLLWSGRAENPKLKAIGQRLLGPLAPIAERYEIQLRDTVADDSIPATDENLEKIVTERSKLVDFSEFRDRLEQMSKLICRVETPGSMGTGFLIGRQTVLTNYHVVKEAIEAGLPGDQIGCRFDFVRAEDGSPGVGELLLASGDGWLISSSPYSQSDITGDGEPKPGELDFALIRLSAPVAADRPVLPLPAVPPIVAPMDVAIIIQHPGGDQLKLAMGMVLELPASGMRYRYNTTTLAGASGAPVFSEGLDLIGLHHAADPKRMPRFNQAVPIWRVATAIKDAGIEPADL